MVLFDNAELMVKHDGTDAAEWFRHGCILSSVQNVQKPVAGGDPAPHQQGPRVNSQGGAF